MITFPRVAGGSEGRPWQGAGERTPPAPAPSVGVPAHFLGFFHIRAFPWDLDSESRALPTLLHLCHEEVVPGFSYWLPGQRFFHWDQVAQSGSSSLLGPGNSTPPFLRHASPLPPLLLLTCPHPPLEPSGTSAHSDVRRPCEIDSPT